MNKLPRHIAIPSELVSCDIVNLYTSIPHSLGMKAVEYWIEKEKSLLPSRFAKEFIMAAISFILHHNNFLFDNVLYHQWNGSGMGNVCMPYNRLPGRDSFLSETYESF